MPHESYPTATTQPPPLQCPPGWYKSYYVNKCYKFINEPVDWLEAKDGCECKHPDATLAQPKSIDELNALVYNIQVYSGSPVSAWIGVNDILVEGR